MHFEFLLQVQIGKGHREPSISRLPSNRLPLVPRCCKHTPGHVGPAQVDKNLQWTSVPSPKPSSQSHTFGWIPMVYVHIDLESEMILQVCVSMGQS